MFRSGRQVRRVLTRALLVGLLVAPLSRVAPLSNVARAATREAGAPRRYWPVVHRGESFVPPAYIKAVQYLLRARGYRVGVDGVFGTQTERAVKRFQAARKLRVTGRVTGAVWEKLIQRVKSGSRGDAVRALQTLLNEEHRSNPDAPSIQVDGTFGAQTDSAVRAYQEASNLSMDGIAGPYTWCQLTGYIDKTDEGFGFEPSPGGRG